MTGGGGGPAAERPAESLRGRVCLVTGSGRGLGAAIARAAGAAGAPLAINCRSDQRGAERVAAEIEAGGGRAIACRADVTDPAQARLLVDETLRVFGRVDVVVNAVGAFAWKALSDVEPAEWRSVFASNLDSVYHLCRLVVPHMRRQHFGRIVNLGTVGAECTSGEPQRAAYAAAKAGVIALSRSLALEEARAGITVNVVSPGIARGRSEKAGPPATPARRSGPRGPRRLRIADVVRTVLVLRPPPRRTSSPGR